MSRVLGWLIAFAVLLSAAPTLANGRDDYIPILDPALRRYIQTALKKEGYFKGPVNGVIGPLTRSAIKRYRIANNIVEIVDYGEAGKEDLTLYLTPKLAKKLLGVELSEEEDFGIEQHAALMRKLGLVPDQKWLRDYVSPND